VASAALPTAPHEAATLIPELRFEVRGASSLDHAAVPTIAFSLAITELGGRQIRSVLLDVQIQIAARQRGYPPETQERLLELFGTPERWSSTLRTLLWTRTTVVVPPFTGTTVMEVPVPCTYDLEVTAARYLAALDRDDGEVPLELLPSGTVFFTTETGALQATRIAWDHELDYRMPVAVWRQAMERHFRDSAWLRCSREQFNRLWAYRSRHTLQSWDATLDALLEKERE
jgi:Family of unknown function (DUF6084)